MQVKKIRPFGRIFAFQIGGTNWTRTSDPHDVNVVL